MVTLVGMRGKPIKVHSSQKGESKFSTVINRIFFELRQYNGEINDERRNQIHEQISTRESTRT